MKSTDSTSFVICDAAFLRRNEQNFPYAELRFKLNRLKIAQLRRVACCSGSIGPATGTSDTHPGYPKGLSFPRSLARKEVGNLAAECFSQQDYGAERHIAAVLDLEQALARHADAPSQLSLRHARMGASSAQLLRERP